MAILERELIIIGGGAGGLAAAIEAKNNGINDILILEKGENLGGILNQCIHNGFGLKEFNEELTGPEYAARFIKEIKRLKIDYKTNAFVTKISRNLVVSYSSIEGFYEVKAKAIVVSTGSYERNAGAISLAGDRLAGIITAGSAQKYLNIEGYLAGKRVVILGSGDIGLIMARRLTLEGAKVICVAELMPYSNGLNRNIVQCLEDFNIPLYLSTTVKKVEGKGRVSKVTLCQVDDHMNYIEGTEKEIACDTLLLSVGLIPNVSLLSNLGAELSNSKGAKVKDNMETLIPGIFSCGNALHVHDLVDYVTMEGREAGKGAANYIKGIKTKDENVLVTYDEHIGYVVPSFIRKDHQDDVSLKFRIRKPIKDVFITISDKEGNILKKVFKPVMIPSEMEIIELKSKDIEKFTKSDIKISIVERGK